MLFSSRAAKRSVIFEEVDINGNGSLSVDELCKATARAMPKQGAAASRTRIEYLVSKFEQPAPGCSPSKQLNLGEFKAMTDYLKHGNAVAEELSEAWSRVEELSSKVAKLDVLRDVFCRGTVLAVALGGSSDIIGALAWARACGYERIVIVQPGSAPRGAASPELQLQEVTRAAPGAAAPGGSFYDNGSMVAYLLSLDKEQLVAGYYLVQPKDHGGGQGFSEGSLRGTTDALLQALRKHACCAVVGLDFGGDVALPETIGQGEPHIRQRDWLNLLAAFAAAKKHGVDARLVAASPGVDAAAVAPEYDVQRQALVSATPKSPVYEMSPSGTLCQLESGAEPPACTLPQLPAALFEHRLGEKVETRFCAELRSISERIMKDVPPGQAAEHASKTYHMLVCAANIARNRADDTQGFFALGQFRSAEKARAHLHSSYATGLYDLRHLAPTDIPRNI